MKHIFKILTFIFLISCSSKNTSKTPKQVNYYTKSYFNGKYIKDSIPKYFDINLDKKNLIYSLKYNKQGQLTDSITKKHNNIRYKFEYEKNILKKRIEYYKGNINSTSYYKYDDNGRLNELSNIQFIKLNYTDVSKSKSETKEKISYSKNGNELHKQTFLNGEFIDSETIITDSIGRVLEIKYKKPYRKIDLVSKYKYLNKKSKLVKEISRFRNGNEFYEKEIYDYDENNQLLLRQVSVSNGFVRLKQKISESGKEYDDKKNIKVEYKIMNNVLIIKHYENIY